MTWLRSLPLVILFAALYFLVWANVEHRKLQIAVENARIQFEPGYVRLRIRVEPDPQNRALAVGIVSDGFSTSSLEELDGDRARITRWMSYPDVPAGEYQAVAEVAKADGSTVLVTERLSILSRGF